MIRKIVICAVIALVLVPATVMAAGFGGQNNGAAASRQGQCLQNGENCADQSGNLGSGNQSQYRYGAQQNGEAGTCGSQIGQGTHGQKHTRSTTCLHDGSCTGLKILQ